MKSFKQLMESLVEAWPGSKEYTAKYGTQKSGLGSEGSDGKKTGNRHEIEAKDGIVRATRKYGKDGESVEQETKSDGTAPTEKRGRGRPAGKYGSYKKKVKESIEFMESLDDSQLEAYLDTLDEETLDELNDALGEDVEQIEELSKSTLGSYVKKVAHELPAQGAATRQFANDSESAKQDHNYPEASKKMKLADKTFAKSWKRRVGVGKAVDRLTKEDVEQVEEAKLEISAAQMSHQGKATIKHIKNPDVTQRMAAHDIKPGVAGYRDRIALLKDAQAKGKLKEDVDQVEETNTIIESRGPEAIAALITKQAKEQ